MNKISTDFKFMIKQTLREFCWKYREKANGIGSIIHFSEEIFLG